MLLWSMLVLQKMYLGKFIPEGSRKVSVLNTFLRLHGGCFPGCMHGLPFLSCTEPLGRACWFIERVRSHNPSKMILAICDKKLIVEVFVFIDYPITIGDIIVDSGL
ncbi:hypothetical protein I3843_05G191100 [Carya illinoinensis]|uniref:Uncharacterized protein n=1 Tax=Carya illinoinensis TaxID=32201 RepID=A0A922F5P1_CARIL|nr:hypothetical protein I3760_05G210600 [Carya illinoinensis]KAG6714550.1 hypothetical protein I3842_05G207400 [Carya illinoinensis]KAG7980610.1 hypothetical protein I3843_05G191100 [Carya illinoinensis]